MRWDGRIILLRYVADNFDRIVSRRRVRFVRGQRHVLH